MSAAELPQPERPPDYSHTIMLPPGYVLEVHRQQWSDDGSEPVGWEKVNVTAVALLVRSDNDGTAPIDVLYLNLKDDGGGGTPRIEPSENMPMVKYDPDKDESRQSIEALRDGLVEAIGGVVSALHNDIGVELFGGAQALGNFQEDIGTEVVRVAQAIDARGTRTPFVPRRWGPPAPNEALAIAAQVVADRPSLETLTDEAWRLAEHVTAGVLDKADVACRLVDASGLTDVPAATAAVLAGLNARRGRR